MLAGGDKTSSTPESFERKFVVLPRYILSHSLQKKKIMEWDRSKINILFINSIPTNRGRSIGNRYKSREFFSCMICVDIFFSTPHDDFIFYFEFSMRYLQKDRTRLEELSCFRDHVDYNEKIPFERLILFLKKREQKILQHLENKKLFP